MTAMVCIMALPMAEAFCRLFGFGISGAQPLTQHITLIIAMVGGAVAARESRLLAISSFTSFFKPKIRNWTSVFAGAFAVFITCVLTVAAWQFVVAERQFSDILAYNVPKWWVQLVMPIGFGIIAVRLWWRSGDDWVKRVVSLVISAASLAFFYKPGCEPASLFWVFLGVLLVATVLGCPLYVTLGGAAVMLFWCDGSTVDGLPVDQYGLVTNPTLPTLPLFTLAGYFLAEGGASERLVRVFTALVGSFRGGTVVMTFLVCAFFTTFTGASGVTILALGGLLLPVILAAGYKERNALGIVTSAGALGLLFPPSLPLILYAIIAGDVSIQQMFLGGLLPGVLMLAIMAGLGVFQGRKNMVKPKPFSVKEAVAALWDAKWELAVPVVAVGALFSGRFTPVEAASLTALYSFFAEVVIYRDLRFSVRGAQSVSPTAKTVSETVGECGLLIGGVLLILGLALGFTNYLVFAEVPSMAVDWATTHIHSPWVFLLCLNLCLLVVVEKVSMPSVTDASVSQL